MPGFRNRKMGRALALRPVNSIKHVVDTNGGITGSTNSVNDIMRAIDDPEFNVFPNQIHTGAVMTWFFLNVQVIQQVVAGGVDNIYLAIYKNIGNNTLFTGGLDAIGVSDLRRYVIHQEMVMTGSTFSINSPVPKTLFKGVIRIPKSLQRFGIQDRLQVIIGHRTGEVTQQSRFCLQCIYKEMNV